MLLDDGACPHRARLGTEFFQEESISSMEWPARSLTWTTLKDIWEKLHLCCKHTISLQNIQKLITSMQRRCEAVINVRGANTDYWLVVSMSQPLLSFVYDMFITFVKPCNSCLFYTINSDFWFNMCNNSFCWTGKKLSFLFWVLLQALTLWCSAIILRGICSPLWLQVNHASTEQPTVLWCTLVFTNVWQDISHLVTNNHVWAPSRVMIHVIHVIREIWTIAVLVLRQLWQTFFIHFKCWLKHCCCFCCCLFFGLLKFILDTKNWRVPAWTASWYFEILWALAYIRLGNTQAEWFFKKCLLHWLFRQPIKLVEFS